MIKVVAPNMSCKVVDWAIQAHGAAGVSQDFWLAEAYAHQRTVRIVDGPDEVHRNAIAKIELAKRASQNCIAGNLTQGSGSGEVEAPLQTRSMTTAMPCPTPMHMVHRA